MYVLAPGEILWDGFAEGNEMRINVLQDGRICSDGWLPLYVLVPVITWTPPSAAPPGAFQAEALTHGVGKT